MNKFGKKVSAKELCFMIDDELYCKWFPQIEVNNKLVYITDENTPTKMVECENHKEAIRYARQTIKNINKE